MAPLIGYDKEKIRERGFELAESILSQSGYNLEFISDRNARCNVPWRRDDQASLDILRHDTSTGRQGDWIDRATNDSGDVFALVAALKGLDCSKQFIEVLKACYQLLSIPIPEKKNPKRQTDKKKKDEPSRESLDAFAEKYGLTFQDFLDSGCRVELAFFPAVAKAECWGITYTYTNARGNREKIKSIERFAQGTEGKTKRDSRWLGKKGDGTGLFFGTRAFESRNKPSAAQSNLIIVGGEEKCIALNKLGHCAVSLNSDSAISKEFAIMLVEAGFRRFTFFFDKEEGQIDGSARELRAACMDAQIYVVSYHAEEAKGTDVNDILVAHGPDDISIRISQAREWFPGNWWEQQFSRGNTTYNVLSDGSLVASRETQEGPVEDEVSGGVYRIAKCLNYVDLKRRYYTLEVRVRNKIYTVDLDGDSFFGPTFFQKLSNAIPNGIYIKGPMSGIDQMRSLADRILPLFPPATMNVRQVGHFEGSETEEPCYYHMDLRVTDQGVYPIHANDPVQCPFGIGKDRTFGLKNGSKEEAKKVAANIAKNWGKVFPTKQDATVALTLATLGPQFAQWLGINEVHLLLAIVGKTGYGKTTLARLMTSLWGFTEITQHSTWLATLQIAINSRHSLAAFDDLRSGHDIAKLVSLSYDGQSRDALRADGTFRHTEKFDGGCIFTAESLWGAGESTLNRMTQIVIEEKMDNLPDVMDCYFEMKEHFGEFPKLVPWLIHYQMRIGKEEIYKKWVQAKKTIFNKGTAEARLADIAALLHACSEVVMECMKNLMDDPFDEAMFTEWFQPDKVIDNILTEQPEHMKSSKPGYLFLEELHSVLSSTERIQVAEVTLSGKSSFHVLDCNSLRPNQIRAYRFTHSGASYLALDLKATLGALNKFKDTDHKAVLSSLQGENLTVSDFGSKHGKNYKFNVHSGGRRICANLVVIQDPLQENQDNADLF